MRGMLIIAAVTAMGFAAAVYGVDPGAAETVPRPGLSIEVITGRSTEMPKSLGRNEVAKRDIREAALTDGVSTTVLLARAEKTPQFEAAIENIRERYPESFTGSGLVREGLEQSWIAFKGDLPTGAREQLVALPFDIQTIAGTGVSAVELENAAASTLPVVVEQFAAKSATAGLDPTTFGIVYHVQGGSEATARAGATGVIDSLARKYAPGLREVQVVHDDSDPIELMTTVQGGRPLTIGHNLECTAGFTAVRNGNRGVLTAKHCANDVSYNFEPGVLTFGAGASDAPKGMIDLQFNRTLSPHSTNGQFRATGRSSADDRTVTQVANPTVGGPVCKWGEMSGLNCSTVAGVDFCVLFDNDIHPRCGLASTTSAITTSGDSGGPWFFTSTARGTTTGGNSWTSYLTQIGRAKTYLDATVIQQ